MISTSSRLIDKPRLTLEKSMQGALDVAESANGLRAAFFMPQKSGSRSAGNNLSQGTVHRNGTYDNNNDNNNNSTMIMSCCGMSLAKSCSSQLHKTSSCCCGRAWHTHRHTQTHTHTHTRACTNRHTHLNLKPNERHEKQFSTRR